jgi:hypothetical protein
MGIDKAHNGERGLCIFYLFIAHSVDSAICAQKEEEALSLYFEKNNGFSKKH